MRGRIRPRKAGIYPRFRRVGKVFTAEWQDIDPAELTEAQLAFLTGPESTPVLEIEGAPTHPPVHPDSAGKKPPSDDPPAPDDKKKKSKE